MTQNSKRKIRLVLGAVNLCVKDFEVHHSCKISETAVIGEDIITASLGNSALRIKATVIFPAKQIQLLMGFFESIMPDATIPVIINSESFGNMSLEKYSIKSDGESYFSEAVLSLFSPQ